LYVVAKDGGTPKPFDVTQFDAVRPSWLPDGNSIVVQDSAGTRTVSIKLVDLKTTRVTTLPESQNVNFPVCSPDGRYVAASTIDAQKLMLFDFGTQKWSELVKMNVGFTEWSKDGKYIYLDTGLSEDPAIYRVRIADRKVERVASLKGLRRVIFAWTPWSGLTPDGSPLLLRDISSQEVYALDFEAP
jgi:Tol biopolymer transport system component